MSPRLSESDQAAFEPDAKIGLLATVSDEGLPHVTLITTLGAKGPSQLQWGLFCQGLSKHHVRRSPRVGWLVMSLDRQVWRGTAEWTGEATEGDDYVRFNRKPMFRYNAYFNIHTVHSMDLVELEPKASLSMPGIAAGTALSALAGRLSRDEGGPEALSDWTRRHLASPTTLKFLAHVADDGFPRIVPVVPAAPAGRRRVVLAPTVHRAEVKAIPPGTPLAVFALNLETESVLLRGAFSGVRSIAGAPAGTVEVDWVYNSMPPNHGQIYPPVPLEAVTEF